MINKNSLRRIALHHQALTKTSPFGKGLPATKAALKHLGYVQIDTLSVVERAHHHTLWTRVPDYKPEYLDELTQKREAFEYWYHAASYLPMESYRFALPAMAVVKRGESRWFNGVDPKAMKYVLERIREEGPLKTRDFESAKKGKGSWWNWKPTKRALEKLFMQGDLMVTRREGMQKVYDLRERVLPSGVNTKEPSLSEFAEYLVETSLKAHGFTSLKQVSHLRSGAELRKALLSVLQQKIEAGTLAEYKLEQMPLLYGAPDLFESKLKAPSGGVRILSPFDNAVIHRDRVEQVFGLDYKLECYVPADKRQFGYFCLPILYKDRLIGRVDCKVFRKANHLELIHLHFEDEMQDFEQFLPLFVKALGRFSKFNNCLSISVSKVSPKKWAAPLKRELK